MPELCRFDGIVIRMFPDDHPWPHFHAAYAEYEAAISIGSWEYVGFLTPARLRRVLAWAREHQTELSITLGVG